ncbi:MAG: hypothetical protein HY049_04850 [Acidobacteria bacterium]|nr:hypothetical protein [Acidobacteriota bacterium]
MTRSFVHPLTIAAATFCLVTAPAAAREAACPSDSAARAASRELGELLRSGRTLDELKARAGDFPLDVPRSCAGASTCDLHGMVAELRLGLQDGDGALDELDDAIAICPPPGALGALKRAGEILIARDEDQRAINYLTRYVERAESAAGAALVPAPDAAGVRRQIVAALHRLGEDERAFALLGHPSLRSFKERAGADDLWMISEISGETQHWEEAAVPLERLINVYPADPRRPEALLHLAKARKRLGQADGARFLFKEILRESPETDAALESRLELLDLPSQGPLDPLVVIETLHDVATRALDSRLAGRAVAQYLRIESAKHGLPVALMTLVQWSRQAMPLSRDAVQRALSSIDPRGFGDGSAARLRWLAAARAVVAAFGEGVLPHAIAKVAAQQAFAEGLFELAAGFSGVSEDSETPAEADEIRGLHIHALLAAARYEEAAADGGRYLDDGAGAPVVLETCRALRALGKWEEIRRRVDAGPESVDVAVQARLELWRAEAVWNLGSPLEAAANAILFAEAQVKRIPLIGAEARENLAGLALLAGDGFYGSGEIGRADRAYALATSLSRGSWQEERAAQARALVAKLRAPDTSIPAPSDKDDR